MNSLVKSGLVALLLGTTGYAAMAGTVSGTPLGALTAMAVPHDGHLTALPMALSGAFNFDLQEGQAMTSGMILSLEFRRFVRRNAAPEIPSRGHQGDKESMNLRLLYAVNRACTILVHESNRDAPNDTVDAGRPARGAVNLLCRQGILQTAAGNRGNSNSVPPPG